ncbi:MAG: RNA polymerase sigma factor [Lachnospiraceae bacterium]
MLFNKNKAESKEQIIEEVLCNKYNSYYRMAYSYTHSEADAADIVQEGAYKAIKYSDSLENPEYAETWIYRIMLNEIYRFLGKKKEIPADDEMLPERGKEDKYEDFDLRRALDSMGEKDKAVIQLRYFEDLSLDEIAKVLDENISTVKSRLYRGLRKLRLEIAEE